MRVVVLGVGAMGSAACRSLARRGHDVVGVERYRVGHDRGSTHGETRLIRQAYFEHADYVPLLKSTYELWGRIERESGRKLFHRVGLALFGPKAESRLLPKVRASAEAHGIPLETWDVVKARKKFPLFRLRADDEALFEPGAGYLSVDEAIVTQAALAVREGAKLVEETKVLGWEPEGGGVRVETTRGPLSADRLVVTTGAWARGLLADLGVGLTVHRNLLFWYSARAAYADTPCFAFERGRHFFYGFPKISAYGVKVADHVPGRPLDEPEQSTAEGWEPDEVPVRKFLEETIPELAWRPSRVKPCLYELTPDENFVLDVHPAHHQVVVGAGFSGHGFKFAPVIGEILADLAERGASRHPIGFLRSSRFSALRASPPSGL